MTARLTGLLLFTCGSGSLAAEVLSDALRAANVPTLRFSPSELGRRITSYAVSEGAPFLLAYFSDDGSGWLPPVLHVIRYDRATVDLRRADLRNIKAVFRGDISFNCLGSALAIREYRGTIYIDTHYNPSAGCVVLLDLRLSFRAAISGWLIGVMGDEYAILRASEVHFLSVHPLHIEVFDLKKSHLAEVYPYEHDALRREFSGLIKPNILMRWCAKNNAQCDAENFDTDLVDDKGRVAVNEQERVFGFEARFDANGFGEAAEKHAPPRNIAYFFRERGGTWEHREFPMAQFKLWFPTMSVQRLVIKKPNLVFDKVAGK